MSILLHRNRIEHVVETTFVGASKAGPTVAWRAMGLQHGQGSSRQLLGQLRLISPSLRRDPGKQPDHDEEAALDRTNADWPHETIVTCQDVRALVKRGKRWQMPYHRANEVS